MGPWVRAPASPPSRGPPVQEMSREPAAFHAIEIAGRAFETPFLFCLYFCTTEVLNTDGKSGIERKDCFADE